MDLLLNNRTYLVTGGSSGVGLATVRMLLGEGANIVTCARDVDRLNAALDDLDGRERILTAACDVRDRDAVADLVARAQDTFGGLDGLVNNAGNSRMKPRAETTLDDWRDEFDLKFSSVLNTVDAALPLLRKSPAPSIVNISAVLARQPETRLVTTSAARAGLLNLSKSLSLELAPEAIRVNSVALGLVDTGQWRRRYETSGYTGSFAEWEAEIAADRGIGLGRFGNADEVAYLVVTLLSPRSSYVTGTSIDVCGGVARYV
ncbi:SDR family oxidoreductase [Rhodococcus sp. HM1]|uniref:SDR family oxidoreductase n=1 Tax=unclassified Rhodococcus (in: high G+C Gram-positive bacteria) TaxID=192944 RepID=UPI0018CDEA85|nr:MULTISPECIES: SDR family oxidoreductase [unclassified Rhodococcus (in: high G+C Gram-positive bacteria)]MBH0121846.1 SDR family oxidoreductase [Rhodococcus sp. CX]MCK8674839.1 SDR family oxidoreductase [Rhodococcus sp. HM1]